MTDGSHVDVDRAFDEAVVVATEWGASNGMTGMRTDRRRRSIGVGLADVDETATTAALRRRVPHDIGVRTRVASAALAGLRQLQVEVFHHLDD